VISLIPRFLEEILKGATLRWHVPVVTLLFFNADDSASTGPDPVSEQSTTEPDESEASWRRHRFRMIYDANYDDLWRYCLRRAANPEEAEEALNETFTVAWRRLDIVPKGDEARPWLFGVARNQLRSGWRKYNRGAELRDRLVHTREQRHAPDPAEQVVDGSSTILMALATLREKDQEILRLAAWEELPHVEIAEIVGCSENAVAIRVHRARGRLATAIAKQHKAAAKPQRNSADSKKVRETVKDPSISSHVRDEPATTNTEGGLA